MRLWFWYELRSRVCVTPVCSIMAGLAHSVPLSRNFSFKNVLVFTKTTRFEIEQERHPDVSANELSSVLGKEGTDVDNLLIAHNEHKKYEREVFQALKDLNITTKVVDRYNISENDIDWADAVIPLGGDGTFLIAASNIRNQNKVIFGFNTNPSSSTGYLCLPKRCSSNIRETLDLIQQGKFSWMFRTRIRITLYGADKHKKPLHLHQKFASRHIQPEQNANCWYCGEKEEEEEGRIIPQLALNEVFVGEKVSSRVTYLNLQLDNKKELIRTKSSGLCVCTGSGSTAWNYTMNRVSRDKVQKLFSLAGFNSVDVDTVVNRYNSSIIFKPDEPKLYYTIRDLISTAEWPKMPEIGTDGYIQNIYVGSSCVDAGLVIDGGYCYDFNTGTSALIQVNPSDALRTIVIDESVR